MQVNPEHLKCESFPSNPFCHYLLMSWFLFWKSLPLRPAGRGRPEDLRYMRKELFGREKS